MEEYTFESGMHTYHIPEQMMVGIREYIDHGVPQGSFLSAVIEHDLFEAVGRADQFNLPNLPAFVAYFYNEAPSPCHGSREKMNAWIEQHQQARENET